MSSHAAQAPIDHHHDHTTSTGIPNKKLVMWTFLASDCMFFGMLIAVHLVYRLHPPPGSPEAAKIFSIELTSFSTFILLMSSLMMALAVNAIQKGNIKSMRWSLLSTIFLGAIFLGCQVYEFDHFVKDRDFTLTNSLFGSTFYTLTGTHGLHVTIGVLWLIMMYVRSFQPVDTAKDRTWFFRNVLHVMALAGVALFALFAVLGLVHAIQIGTGLGGFFSHSFGHLIGLAVTTAACLYFARPRGPVAFGEANAIDVESMGLYWHFVDIVWIVIFTVVYLLEYI